jgi:hypothetical protein
MAKKKVDFTGVENYTRCEEGQHIAKLVKIEEKETQAGDDMMVATFEVTRGESKGARVFENFVLTEKALWKLKGYLEAVGMKAEGKVVIDFDKLLGKACIIEVAHEEYNGTIRAKINAYKSLDQAPDDDEDDDDEPTPKKKAKKEKAKKKTKPEPEDDDWDDDDWED